MEPRFNDLSKNLLLASNSADLFQQQYDEAFLSTAIEISRAYTAKKEITDPYYQKKMSDLCQNVFVQQSNLFIEQNHLSNNSQKQHVQRVQQVLNDAKQKFDKKVQLKSKIALKHVKKSFDELENRLQIGIATIKDSLSLALQLHCRPEELTFKDLAQKSDRLMQELIEEEQNAKKASQKPTKKAISKAKKKPSQENKSTIEMPTAGADTLKVDISKADLNIGLKDNTISKFALKLMEDSFRVLEHPRIHRWKTENTQVIRGFVDQDSQGKKIYHYQNLTDEQIIEQRVRHFLPGTERLLKNPLYRAIYTFPTNRGYGMVAQLSIKDTPCNGILYFGIDENELVFHKYFEEVDFKVSTKNFFQDTKQTLADKKDPLEEEWSSKEKFNLDINQKGILEFAYASHKIRILPIQNDLFAKALYEHI